MNSSMSAGANEPKLGAMTSADDVTAPGVRPSAEVPVSDAGTVKILTDGATISVPEKPTFDTFGGVPRFDLQDFPCRWMQLRTTALSSANTGMAYGSTATVDTFLVYNSFINGPGMQEKFQYWRYWRAAIEIRAVPSLPGNASGAYAMCALPYSDDPIAFPPVTGWGPVGFNEEDVLAYEHSALLTVASSAEIHFDLPFWSTTEANPTNMTGGMSDWMIKVVCVSPLRTAVAGGVSTGQITWYARLKPGYELLVPKYQGLPRAVYQGRKQAIIDTAKEWKKNKTVSSTAATVGKVAAQLSAVPFLGPVAASVAGAASTVGAIADFFGFTREDVPEGVDRVFTTSVQNVALVDGKDQCQMSGFTMSNKISISPSITGGEDADPLSFESFGGRWKQINAFNWSSSSVAGTVLSNDWVTPGWGMGNLSQLAVTPAGYCGLPFEFWRAKAEYLVIVPASTLHRGALQVVYTPLGEVPPTSAANKSNTGMGAILDIESASAFQFTVGFANNQPMLPLRYFCESVGIKPVASANGSFQLRVVNPLVSQNPTDTLHVVVFARFSEIQFAVPRTTVPWYTEGGMFEGPWEDCVVLQGKTPGSDVEDSMLTQFELVPSSGRYPIDQVVAGEEVGSLRALAQRPSRIWALNSLDPKFILPGGGGQMDDVTPTRLTTALLAASPFIATAASEKVRIVPLEDTWFGVFSEQVKGESFTIDGYIPANCPVTFTGAQRGAEFHIPYYFPRRARYCGYTSSCPDSNGQKAALGRLLSVVHLNGTQPYAMYYSFGSDIRVAPFLRVPRFAFRDEWTTPQYFGE